MKDIIQDIYEEMAIERLGMSEKEFSRSWLCMSETYWAYIKSTGASPSAECLVRLYGRLKQQRQVCEYQMKNSRSAIQGEFIKNLVVLYGGLEDKARAAIDEYALSQAVAPEAP